MCLCGCGAALVGMPPDTGYVVVCQLWIMPHSLCIFSCHCEGLWTQTGPGEGMWWGSGVRGLEGFVILFEALGISTTNFIPDAKALWKTGCTSQQDWRGCAHMDELQDCLHVATMYCWKRAAEGFVWLPSLRSLITGSYSAGCCLVSASHPWSCLKGSPSHLMRHGGWKPWLRVA